VQYDLSGWGYFIMDVVAVVALGAVLYWASRQSSNFRRQRHKPLNARSASPQEATQSAPQQAPEKSAGNYLLGLSLPLLAALLITAYLFARYMPGLF
jgi:hypothetical protein